MIYPLYLLLNGLGDVLRLNQFASMHVIMLRDFIYTGFSEPLSVDFVTGFSGLLIIGQRNKQATKTG